MYRHALSTLAAAARASSTSLASAPAIMRAATAPALIKANEGAASVFAGNALAWRAFGSDGGYLNRDDVTARVMEVVKKFDKVEQSKVTPTSNFKSDLGLDSLDETEVVMAFEEEFNIDIPDAEADKIKSLEDAINFVTADPNAK